MLQTGTPWRVKDTAIPNNAGTTVINQDCLPRHQTLWASSGSAQGPPFPPTAHRLSPTSLPCSTCLQVSHPPHSCSALSGLSLEGTWAGRSPLTPETRLVPSHRLPGHPEHCSSLLLSSFTGCGCLPQPPRCLASGLGNSDPCSRPHARRCWVLPVSPTAPVSDASLNHRPHTT